MVAGGRADTQPLVSCGFISLHKPERRKWQDLMLPLRALPTLWSLPAVAPTSAHPGDGQEVVSPEGFAGRVGLSWRWGGSIQ